MTEKLGCDIVGRAGKIFCPNRVFLCHERVSQGKEELCRDRVFSCRDRV